jgi:hypothetical protein
MTIRNRLTDAAQVAQRIAVGDLSNSISTGGKDAPPVKQLPRR